MERNTSDILMAVSLHKIQLLYQVLHCLIMVMPCRLHLHILTHLSKMYMNIERLSFRFRADVATFVIIVLLTTATENICPALRQALRHAAD